MATFTLNSITVQGLNIIARLVAGSTLEFTRIAVGDGAMPSDKTPLTVTDLSHRLFDVPINKVESYGNQEATVSGIFDNKGLETGFFYRELGLYAKDPNTKEEVLYCYGNAAADAEWIPPSGASSIIEKQVKIVTLVGNAEKVTADIKSGIYATKEELEESLKIKADLDAPAEDGGRVLAEQMRFDAQQTLYVDAAAKEDGDGSEQRPFKTIQAAIDARYLGAAVIYIKIKPGTYPENIQTPRTPGTTWRFTREGTGAVTINTAIIDNCNYLLFDNLTFGGPVKENSTVIYLANVATVNFNSVTVNGATNATGISLSTSCGVIKNTVINNCGLAIAATDGAYVNLENTSGIGNVRGVHSAGAVVVCGTHTIQATTPLEKINGGVINVDGGASSFPSNYTQLKNLGTFNDANSLKAALQQELGALKTAEAVQCSFVLNFNFGLLEKGQIINCMITKTSNSEKGNGIILYYSDNPATPGAYMQINNGNYIQDAPVAFVSTVKVNSAEELRALKGYTFFEGTAISGEDETLSNNDFQGISMSYAHQSVQILFNHKQILYRYDETRNQTTPNYSNWIEIAPQASIEQPGLLRVADTTDELNCICKDAAITPKNLYNLVNFRIANIAYSIGDKVACKYNHELFLECTKAGTTSNTALDTRNVKHGQVLTDGGLQWTVRTHIKSVNGVVAGADGNVKITIPTSPVTSVNGQTGAVTITIPKGVKDITISGKTITVTFDDGTKKTLTTQDTNSAYMPNYTSRVQIAVGDYTPASNGIIILNHIHTGDGQRIIITHKSSGLEIVRLSQARYPGDGTIWCPVVKNETYTITVSGGNSKVYFCPLKAV